MQELTWLDVSIVNFIQLERTGDLNRGCFHKKGKRFYRFSLVFQIPFELVFGPANTF